MRRVLISIIIFVLPLGELTAKGISLRTNEAIFSEFLIDSVDSLINIGKINPLDTLIVDLKIADPELLVFIHRKLFERLLQKGFDKIFEKGQQHSNITGIVLYYQLLNWQVYYQLIPSGWLRHKWVRRNIVLQQGIILQQSNTGKVIWSGELNRQFQDRIRSKDIGEVENAYLKFTRGEFLNHGHNLRKWAQALFLLGISATIVYLFFAIRSY